MRTKFMIKARLVVFSSLLIVMTVANGAEKEGLFPHKVKEQFNNKITSLYKNYNLQGDLLIGVVGESGLMYSHSLNKKLLNGEYSTLNNDVPFFVASHTKSMTGTLLKILEEEGKLDLDKSLHDYLPDLITDEKIDAGSIKVRQLLNHTAGFMSIMHTFKTAFLGFKDGNKELLHALNHNTRSAPAGKFRYSNTGPIIAGMIVEKITGNSWQDEMKQRIFNPLNMNNTSSKVSDYQANEILPSIETTADNYVFRSRFHKKDATMHAAGGTISTINDLAKWLRFNINQESSIIQHKSSFEELHQATTLQNKTYFTYKCHGYSLGWDIATYYGETILTRFGGTGGISFHASFIPSRKIGIVAFFNEERAYKLPHLAANLLYNLMSENRDADKIFQEEKVSFQKTYDNVMDNAFSNDMLLELSESNDKFVGTYRNSDGWPEIKITRTTNNYLVKWGLLTGPLIASRDQKRPILGAFGPLNREFGFSEDGQTAILMNGSLKYYKDK